MLGIGVGPPNLPFFLFDGFQTGSLPYCLVSVSGEDRMAISHLAGLDPGPWAGAVRMHFWKAHNAFLQFDPRAFAVKMQNHPRRHRLQTTANVRQLTNVMEWWETFSSATNARMTLNEKIVWIFTLDFPTPGQIVYKLLLMLINVMEGWETYSSVTSSITECSNKVSNYFLALVNKLVFVASLPINNWLLSERCVSSKLAY